MEQNHSDWQRREDLIDELLGMSEDGREAFIAALAAEAPHDADALRRWLKGIEQPLAHLDPPSPALAIGQGDLIGHWRVLSPIGRGGMGEVWLGERADGLFEKKVAIKFIRGDRAGLRGSIESERQLLAGLQHPGIVRLLDAGVNADGHAFLVTEFIEGTTLDVWLEQRRPSLAQRLDLLHQISNAVAYAHERLVIHRDIKPRNIIIDHNARAYLLDFGIARALVDPADALQTTNLILTPEFAAPELIVENVASVRSDIYTLGGVLYFLLCEKPPLSVRGLPLLDAIKVIRDEMPPHTITATGASFPGEPRRLLADLDSIALKALAKSPRERYGTVEAFLADIGAARANLPILASPPSTWDRSLRYLRRHKIAITIAAIVALSLLAGMAGTLWQAHEAKLQSLRAEAEAARAKASAKNATAVRDFLVEIFSSASPENARGKVPTAIELLDTGVHRVEAQLGDQPELQAQLLDTIGAAYNGLAQIDKATDAMRRAHAIAVTATGEDSPLATKLTIDFALAVINRSSNKQLYEELSQRLEKIVNRPEDSLDPALRISALTEYGALRGAQGNSKDAEKYLRDAVAFGHKVAPQGSEELAIALFNLSFILYGKGHISEAVDTVRESLVLRERLFPPISPAVAESQRMLATLSSVIGNLDEAADLMGKVQETTRILYGDTNAEYCVVLYEFSNIRSLQGRLTEAEALAGQALAILKKAGLEGSIPEMHAYNWLALAKGRQRDWADAIENLRASLAIATKAFGGSGNAVLSRRQNLAGFEGMNGAYVSAEHELRDVIAIYQKAGSDNIVSPMRWLGNLRRLQGDPIEARSLHTQALEKAKALFGENGFLVYALQLELALDERNLQMFDQARVDAETAKRMLQKLQHDTDTIDAQDVRGILAQLDALQGRCAGAVAELESTWKRHKELQDTPVNQWQTAEASLFLALCRKDIDGSSSGEAQSLLTTSVRTLRASPLADPYIKRLAETVQTSK